MATLSIAGKISTLPRPSYPSWNMALHCIKVLSVLPFTFVMDHHLPSHCACVCVCVCVF